MMKQVIFEIVDNKPLNDKVMQLTLRGDTSAIVTPGQFVNIKIDGAFLRRPLSVCDVKGNQLTLVYMVKGSGTELLSRMQSGKLDVLTGLGNGFDLSAAGASPLLIGGGLGFTPLYYLAKELITKGTKPTVILGFASADDIVFESRFITLGAKRIVCTEDGSFGRKGLVSDIMNDFDYSYFYACGPEPMFKAINNTAATDGEFSFEARMGCGFGACMGCTCETIAGAKRICRDGPVMKRSELIWQT